MLVLTRKANEAICIDQNIRITVLSISGGKVRLGIDAPQDVPIHREEVQKRIFSDEQDVLAHANCQPMS